MTRRSHVVSCFVELAFVGRSEPLIGGAVGDVLSSPIRLLLITPRRGVNNNSHCLRDHDDSECRGGSGCDCDHDSRANLSNDYALGEHDGGGNDEDEWRRR